VIGDHYRQSFIVYVLPQGLLIIRTSQRRVEMMVTLLQCDLVDRRTDERDPVSRSVAACHDEA